MLTTTGRSVTEVAALLEPQHQAITNATIVTHGFQIDGNRDTGWTYFAWALTDAENARGRPTSFLDYHAGSSTFDVELIGAPQHIVLLWDWADASNNRSEGWAEAAGDSLFATIKALGLVSNNIDLHFIGHSFGSVVTSEAVERLSAIGATVDQVTYLDPHDFNQDIHSYDTLQGNWRNGRPHLVPDDSGSLSYGATVWNGVEFSDAYYQVRGKSVDLPDNETPLGRPIPGAFNVNVTSLLPDEYNDTWTAQDWENNDHSWIWSHIYQDSIIDPPTTLAPQGRVPGFGLSAIASTIARPSSAGYGENSFYDINHQSHLWSSELLVDGTINSGGRIVPDPSAANALGRPTSEVDQYRPLPNWQPLAWNGGNTVNGNIFNGDFAFPGSSGEVPGWSFHGGNAGFVEQNSGNGAMRLGGRTVYVGTTGVPIWQPEATHNLLYVPSGATQLAFKVWGTLDQSQYRLNVFLGDTLATNYSFIIPASRPMDEDEPTFPLPPGVAGTATTIRFVLESLSGHSDPNNFVYLDDVHFIGTTPANAFDLVASDVSVIGSASANSGSPITVQAAVSNQGNASSSVYSVRFYLASNASSTASDIPLGTAVSRTSPIAAGGVDQFNYSPTIPAGVPAGEYWVRMVVTSSDDTSNNSRPTSTRISINQPAIARGDLALLTVDAVDSTVAGSILTTYTTIKNFGNATSSGYTVEFYLSENGVFDLGIDTLLLTTSQQTALPAGRDTLLTNSLPIPSGTQAGDYRVIAVLRPTVASSEANYSNHVLADANATTVQSPIAVQGFQYPLGDALVGSQVSLDMGQGFGTNHGHLGTDIPAAVGTTVKSIGKGVVTQVIDGGPEWGQVVIVRHDTKSWGWSDDTWSMYAHVVPLVSVGDPVERGQTIATIANPSLGSTGPHLHLEVRRGASAAVRPGIGYSGADFNRASIPSTGYVIPGYRYDIRWFDPQAFISQNRFNAPPPSARIDLDPAEVDAVSSTIAGNTINVFTKVENLWSAATGTYVVEYRLSSNDAISPTDTFLKSVTRPGIAGNSSQSWTEVITIPAGTPAGSYYVGVIVDPANAITEINETNNWQADSGPTRIAAASTSAADLRGKSLSIAPNSPSYTWGQQISLAYNIENVGDATSTSSTVRFQLVNDPKFPTFTQDLGTRSISALTPGQQGGNNAQYILPSAQPVGYSGGPLYIRMKVEGGGDTQTANNFGQGERIDWVRLPVYAADAKPDLIGTGFTLSPASAYYQYGQQITATFDVTNQGGSASPQATFDIFLSTDKNFGEGDYRLYRRYVGPLTPGQTQSLPFTLALPSILPPEFATGPVYIGAVIDPNYELDESNSSNNRATVAGEDYVGLTLIPVPVSNPVPQISAFSVAEPSVVIGQAINLLATNVVDDQLVNDVVFYADLNNSGQIEGSDRLLAYGTKSGVNFSARVSTAGLPPGALTLLAQAIDNTGIVSPIKSTTMTLVGIGGGPFPDDGYENNDTETSATYLGGAGTYTLSSLALAAGDADYYSFDVTGTTATVQATISFTQTAFQGVGVPTGNLNLEIRPVGVNTSNGFSDTSVPGATSEQVTASVGQRRYVAIVRGAASYEQNSTYNLTVQVTPPVNSPTLGTFTASAASLTQGQPLGLTLSSITTFGGSTVVGADFYLDRDQDGQISGANEYLGSDWGLPDGPGGYTISPDTHDWPAGTQAVYVRASDSLGRNSLAKVVRIEVQPNDPPTIATLSAPGTAVQGGLASLTATNVADPDTIVSGVAFFLDTNVNGAWDQDDLGLGAGTQTGANWTLSANTTQWPLGPQTLFAIATDQLGAASTPVATTITITPTTNQQPSIGSLVGPESVIKGQSIPLAARSVTDPNGDTLTVRFHNDTNGDGVLNSGDTLLGVGTQSGADWALSVPSSPYSQGVQRFFAEATDSGIPAFRDVVTLLVTVVDTTGPRIVAQSPTAPITGSISSVRVTFDEPINPTTFDLGDIATFVGPSGSIVASNVIAVSGTNNTQFDVFFPTQTTAGSYQIVIGPNVADVAGNAMNQDNDATNGEASDDRYSLVFSVSAPLADFVWAKSFGGSATEIIYGIDTDVSGNVYITGQFSGTVDFDPSAGVASRSSLGSGDIFVAKFTPSGTLSWVQTVGGTSNDQGTSIALDGSGNVYVAGIFSTTVDFDPGAGVSSITSPGGVSAFVLKLNSSGNFLWVRTALSASGGQVFGNSVGVDSTGSVVLGGRFSLTADFGGATRTSSGDRDIYLAKWSSSGALQWANSYGSSGYDDAAGLAVDASGNVLAAGAYNGSVTFGATTLNAPAGSGFATKTDANGNVLWAVDTGAPALSATFDSMGSTLIAGQFSGTLDFDPSAGTHLLTSSGGNDAFVTKLSTNGALLWAKNFGGIPHDVAYSVASDSANNVIVTGGFDGNGDFDPGSGVQTIQGFGTTDAFVVKLDSNGNYAWARALGSTSIDRGYATTVDTTGNVYFAGHFSGTAQNDPSGAVPITLTVVGGWDAFIAKINQPTPVINSAPVLAAIGNKAVNELAALSFTVTATDPNAGQTKSFSLDAGAPVGASINSSTGLFTWTPTEVQGPGVYLVTVRVTDNGIPALNDFETISITVNEVNLAPSIPVIAAQSTFEGVLLQFAVVATDPDQPANGLSFSLDPGFPTGASINASSGVFSFTPTESQGPGTYSAVVRVTDNGTPSLSATRSFQINVFEANQAPTLVTISNRQTQRSQVVSFTAVAADADVPAQTLTYSLEPGAPAGASINPTTGAFLWTVSAAQAYGYYPITVRVTDNASLPLSATQSFVVSVVGNTPQVSAVALDGQKVFNFTTGGIGSVFADATDGLFTPIGSVYDAAGNLYVSDVLSSRIYKFNPAGVGSVFADIADGVVSPAGITIDASGNLYVANYLGNTITKLTPAGVGTVFADAADGINHPFDVAVDPVTGSVFVANLDAQQILRFSTSGLGAVFADASDGLFAPIGVAVDAVGNVYVSDVFGGIAGTVYKFSPSGSGSVFADFFDGIVSPTGMSFDSSGNLYVANYLGNTITKLTPAGVGTVFADAADGINHPFDVAFGFVPPSGLFSLSSSSINGSSNNKSATSIRPSLVDAVLDRFGRAFTDSALSLSTQASFAASRNVTASEDFPAQMRRNDEGEIHRPRNSAVARKTHSSESASRGAAKVAPARWTKLVDRALENLWNVERPLE